jgi:hypothetical protein
MAQNGRTIDGWERIWKEAVLVQSMYHPASCLEGLRITKNSSVRIASTPAEIHPKRPEYNS